MSFSFDKQTYWKGPYGILVPDSTKQVIAIDNCNMISRDGLSTCELATCHIPSEDEWKAEHAYKNGNVWYYLHPVKKIQSTNL